MSDSRPASLGVWVKRHAVLVWLGIALNLALIVPLVLAPAWVLGLLHIPLEQLVWARFAGVLLFIISCYYVPATIDIERHRVSAWLAVFPSRAGGATFFFLAVFVFDQPHGFLVGVLVDGFIGLTTLYCLIKIHALEARRRTEGFRT